MRIAFIGAGSFVFTKGLVRDILTFPSLRDATIVLMDIHKGRLEYTRRAAERLVEASQSKARVVATTNRKQALKGADFVVITILAGATKVWRHDIEIPKRFGIDVCVGDTRGISGIFRALRTIPVMLDICKDIESLCPGALVLNYTNPMAMLCRAVQKKIALNFTGLCHSVQGTAGMLAQWINADINDIDYLCAGINHTSWFLEYRKNGKDAYPQIRRALKNRDRYESEYVRNEMFSQLGYYVTESSGHNSEYNWWFRKRPDLVRKYCRTLKHSKWNPGGYAYILKSYLKRDKTWEKEIKDWFKQPLDLERGHEYAVSIMNAWMGGESIRFNGNIPNTGIITNLPTGVCVETPVFVTRERLNPVHVGDLPASVHALTAHSVNVEEMAVEAALTGDPELAFHACAHAPLAASVLSLAEIRKMVREMLRKNRNYLPQFKSVSI